LPFLVREAGSVQVLLARLSSSRTGVAYQCLYERDCTLSEVMTFRS